jgi:hypothetical protein
VRLAKGRPFFALRYLMLAFVIEGQIPRRQMRRGSIMEMSKFGQEAYLVSGAFIVWITDSHRRAIRRLRAEEAQRHLLLR